MRIVRVSGTIRKAEEEAVKRARADILKARRGVGDGHVEPGQSSALASVLATDTPDAGLESIEDIGEEEEEEDEEGLTDVET